MPDEKERVVIMDATFTIHPGGDKFTIPSLPSIPREGEIVQFDVRIDGNRIQVTAKVTVVGYEIKFNPDAGPPEMAAYIYADNINE